MSDLFLVVSFQEKKLQSENQNVDFRKVLYDLLMFN